MQVPTSFLGPKFFFFSNSSTLKGVEKRTEEIKNGKNRKTAAFVNLFYGTDSSNAMYVLMVQPHMKPIWTTILT
jgi:hypothetical protein